MKALYCKDMGMSDNYVARAETEEEVIKMAMEHVKEVHKDKYDQMMKDMSMEEMEDMMREKMRDE